MAKPLARNEWPAWLRLNGFVLRSLDVFGLPALEAERICGFQFGLFGDGIALYRLDDRLVQAFLADPERNLHVLDLYIVGFNDQRGPRDWDAMEIASYYGDVTYNGYSNERIASNAAHFSPSATPFDREQTAAMNQLVAEISNLYARNGFIAKILFRSPRPHGRPPHEIYPPGGGIREYQLLKRHRFTYVTSYSGEAVRNNERIG